MILEQPKVFPAAADYFEVLRRRPSRFAGAGGSAEREFRRLLRQNIREQWKVWLFGTAMIAGAAASALYLDGIAARFVAATGGFLLGVFFVMFSLGGHISAFRWWLGAEGERETGKQIEKLGPEWHCEHDLEHGRGNWDHVLVGPSGVFLLDSKLLHGTVAAGGDALRSGRMVFSGARFRSSAKRVKHELEARLGFRAPWVQAVVVIWGDFPQTLHDERDVIYVQGEHLVSWLSDLPAKANAPQRAAYSKDLQEVRYALAAEGATA